MTEQQAPQVTRADVHSLADKLKALKPSLSVGEQQALRLLVARAGGDTQDVRGFKYDEWYSAQDVEDFLRDLDDFYRPRFLGPVPPDEPSNA